MGNVFERIGRVFSDMQYTGYFIGAVLFVAFFSAVYYFLFKFLKDSGADIYIKISVPVLLVSGLALLLVGNGVNGFFLLLPLAVVLFAATVYSVEFKSAIWRRSNLKLSGAKYAVKNYSEVEVGNCIDEIIRALQNMSKNDIGAIIVLSNNNVPERILESGVEINSDITSQLIESIFFPKTPLHDGAMVINGTKITAAGCFLPLSQKENLPKELGTRHRAAIGITENIDVTTLIVSEETGIISVAKGGNITRYADSELLRKTLSKFYWQDVK
ncbi:MAG: TIGR00159 family protein [Bacillota bacterium]|nr:MAG: TIGR00159 family protein [Bacillota bacterium]